jgi:hypothetical protein
MDNFDLKKYLVENKVTMNSRMLTEQVDTEAKKPEHSRMMKEDEKVEASPEAIKTYLTLLKDKFGHKLGQFIEDELYDSMNMGNYTLPEEWNDEEFSKWAKMDLEWNASEGGEEVIDSNFAEDLFKSNLKLYGVEDYL